LKLAALSAYPPTAATAALQQWSQSTTTMRGAVAVAFSGGADSTCLLLEEARLRSAVMLADRAGASHSVLHAFHVNHGLQAAASTFEAHAQAFCDALSQHVPTRLSVRRVEVPHVPGASIEAQAREARYDALAAMAQEQGVGTVLLAQHADDQVETMLIALTRGAGVAGLAGMAPEFEHRGVRFARPLLDVAGPELREWVVRLQIPYVQDPSNDDERHPRNRLRRLVLPALQSASPTFRATFARSARLCASAREVIDDVAQQDGAHVGTPPSIRHVQALTPARQAEVLRAWLRSAHHTTASEAQVRELLRVLAVCVTPAHGIHLRVGRGHVVRVGDRLGFL
jgi:tRNA(Ile)-lysidine synthase